MPKQLPQAGEVRGQLEVDLSDLSWRTPDCPGEIARRFSPLAFAPARADVSIRLPQAARLPAGVFLQAFADFAQHPDRLSYKVTGTADARAVKAACDELRAAVRIWSMPACLVPELDPALTA
ncbi:hypothetical protein [Nakamurella leprariae]|uniref:Uncharacterized protein n=1 Tax=Nakamurella leprariae TaxID=2803911 RepID=A0A938YDY0_9ACTN|nr:hypothetical protein [Nakamurella leprariae]MBM9466085.1 hypothetical protein [Nakamurella leprariae]